MSGNDVATRPRPCLYGSSPIPTYCDWGQAALALAPAQAALPFQHESALAKLPGRPVESLTAGRKSNASATMAPGRDRLSVGEARADPAPSPARRPPPT